MHVFIWISGLMSEWYIVPFDLNASDYNCGGRFYYMYAYLNHKELYIVEYSALVWLFLFGRKLFFVSVTSKLGILGARVAYLAKLKAHQFGLCWVIPLFRLLGARFRIPGKIEGAPAWVVGVYFSLSMFSRVYGLWIQCVFFPV